jgi:endoplasmic reticulum chaperone BiP
VKDTTDWIDANGQSATADDLEEKLSGVLLVPDTRCPFTHFIAEVQAIVNPITSKLYAGGAGPQSHGPGEEDEEFDGGRSHDEL